MTEEQLRDVLARVVPEPPDSVADPTPVVRAARRQRRVANALVAGAAAVAVVGSVLGFQALREDDGPDFVDRPAQIADAYATAPCPDPTQPVASGAVTDLEGVTAVRYCTRLSDKVFQSVIGPADALVVGLDAFAETVREIPDADPARCADVSVVPTDNQIIFQRADGSLTAVGTGLCDDVVLEGGGPAASPCVPESPCSPDSWQVIDGNSLVHALVAALREQRDAHDYTTSLPAPDVDWCLTDGMNPAAPTSEHLVAATWCGPNSPTKGGEVLDEATVARLDAAWRSAEPTDPDDLLECEYNASGTGLHILARTDRGDVVRLDDQGCDTLSFSGQTLDFAIDELG